MKKFLVVAFIGCLFLLAGCSNGDGKLVGESYTAFEKPFDLGKNTLAYIQDGEFWVRNYKDGFMSIREFNVLDFTIFEEEANGETITYVALIQPGTKEAQDAEGETVEVAIEAINFFILTNEKVDGKVEYSLVSINDETVEETEGVKVLKELDVESSFEDIQTPFTRRLSSGSFTLEQDETYLYSLYLN